MKKMICLCAYILIVSGTSIGQEKRRDVDSKGRPSSGRYGEKSVTQPDKSEPAAKHSKPRDTVKHPK